MAGQPVAGGLPMGYVRADGVNAVVYLGATPVFVDASADTWTMDPDLVAAELETLARWGITGLWLIGLWRRSPASRKIKVINGYTSSATILTALEAGELNGFCAWGWVPMKAMFKNK